MMSPQGRSESKKRSKAGQIDGDHSLDYERTRNNNPTINQKMSMKRAT